MKKLIIGIVMALALMMVSSNAFAGVPISVTGTVDYIQLHKDAVPMPPCDLVLTFTTANGQVYTLPAFATGVQLNLALLEAQLMNGPVSLELEVVLSPFSVEVLAVDFQ